MVKVLIDKNSIQVFGHFEELIYNGYGTKIEPNPNYLNRLATFLSILSKFVPNDQVVIDTINKETLKDVSMLIMLTRIRPFAEGEMNLIIDFLKKPHNRMLLMSNHNPDQFLDYELMVKLGIELLGGYHSGQRGIYTEINSTHFQDYEKILASINGKEINSIMTNTCCRIDSKVGHPFIYLPESMKGKWSSEHEEHISKKVFSLIIDGSQHKHDVIKGKLIVFADSGFIGDKGSTFPGYGLIDKVDNKRLIERILLYLLN